MGAIYTLRFLALIVTSVGLGMIGHASFTLLRWSVGAKLATHIDEAEHIIRASLDVTYGLLPAGAGLVMCAFAVGGDSAVSPTTFWLVYVGAIVYVFGYFGFLRRRLSKFRYSVWKRRREAGA